MRAYLFDDTQRVATAFGATNTPHVFLLERKAAKFVVAYIGAIDNNPRNASQADKKYVEDAVNALLRGNLFRSKKQKQLDAASSGKMLRTLSEGDIESRFKIDLQISIRE